MGVSPDQDCADARHPCGDRQPQGRIDRRGDPADLTGPPSTRRGRRPGRQAGQGRIQRQHIVGQLGADRLVHQPGGHDPAQQEAHLGARPHPPGPGNCEGRSQGARPEGQVGQQQVVAGGLAVMLLPPPHLAEQVLAHRLVEEGPMRLHPDGDEPGRSDHQHQGRAPSGMQPLQPRRPALGEDEPERRGPADDQHDRSLQQQTHRQGRPEARRVQPAGALDPAEIGLQQRALGRQDRGQQAGVDLGHAGLKAEQGAHRQQQPRACPRARAKQQSAEPGGQQHRQHRGDQRGQAVGPDRRPRPSEQGGRPRLQPVDAHRLQVARPVLEPDVDEVVADQHLARGLEIARLVPVHRRQARAAGQEQGQRHQGQHQIGLPADRLRPRGVRRQGRRAQAPLARLGGCVRRVSQITPSRSTTPTSARPQLVYLDTPAVRARWRTSRLIRGWP